MGNHKKYHLAFATLAAANASIGFLFFNYNLSVFSSLLPFLQDYVFPDVSDGVITFIASAPTITAAIGALIAGPICARYGRRKLMIISDFIAIIGVILTLVASIPVIIVGRLLIGFNLGTTTVAVPLYFTEIPPVEYRGPLSTGPSNLGALGTLIAFCLALLVPKTMEPGETSEIWRVLLAVSILIAAFRTICFLLFFRYETPQYYVGHNQLALAEKALGQVYKGDDIKTRLEEIVKDRDYVNSRGKVKFLELFTKKYRKALFVGVVMYIMQHIAGLNIMMVFAQTIFGAGIDDPDDNLPEILSIIFAAMLLFVAFFLVCGVNKYKRKPLLVIGTFFTGLIEVIFAVISLSTSEDNLAGKIVLLFWPVPFVFSLGSIINMMMPETLPEIGMSVCLLANWITGFLTVQFFPDISDAIGIDGTFMIMGCVTIVSAVFFWRYSIETRGKNKLDILKEYNGLKEMEPETPTNKDVEMAKDSLKDEEENSSTRKSVSNLSPKTELASRPSV